MYFVYILKSELYGTHYIGSTSNIESRLISHNNGSNKSTKFKRPWRIVYKEECPDLASAMSKERLFKSYKGGNAFKKLIQSS